MKRTAWSHRGIVAAAMMVVVAATALAVERRSETDNPYSLRFNITPGEQTIMYDVTVFENATGEVVMHPQVMAAWSEWATLSGEHDGRAVQVRMRMRPNEPAQLFLSATQDGKPLQRSAYTWRPQSLVYNGEPVSLTLKEAKLKEVLGVFSQMTGYDVDLQPGVEGLVTLDVVDVPWDQALEIVARQNGLTVTIEGRTIHVTK